MFGESNDDGIPLSYPLGINGCEDGLPSEYCEGYQFQSGGLGAIELANLPLKLTASALVGAVTMRSYGGPLIGGDKDSRTVAGLVVGAMLGAWWFKK